jgi:FkbM family methyltransferase
MIQSTAPEDEAPAAMSASSLLQQLGLWTIARYAQRAILFGALPTRDGARFLGRGRLFVSPRDNRGLRLRRHVGVLQPLVTFTWRRIIELIQPTAVIDIGANYGEVTFCARYPRLAEIYVIEPNPHLLPYLERSRAAHRDGGRMHLVDRVASDRSGDVVFTVDEKWSGTSSAIGQIEDPTSRFKGQGPERFCELHVEAIRIDDLLTGLSADRLCNLAIKIDVEGYEGRVLQGMTGALRRAGRFLGIVEFDADNLQRAGTSPAEVLARMRALGTVASFGHDGQLVVVESSEPPASHCDLILTSDPLLLPALTVPGRLRRYIH